MNNQEVIPPEYRVDMIRLQSRIYKQKVESHLTRLDSELNAEYWENYKVGGYRHNWRIRDINAEGEECSFYVACQNNSEQITSHKTNVVLEYNPTTCNGSKLLDQILHLFSMTVPTVKSIDVAVDFHKVNIDWLTIVKGNKRKKITLDHGGDDKTYYVGAEGSHLRVKIYNKAKERRKKKKGYQVPYDDWTRYEITLKLDLKVEDIEKFDLKKEIPNLVYISPRNIEKLSDTDIFILRAIKNNFGSINDLGRRKKEKLRKYVQDENRKLIKPILIEDTIKTFVSDLCNDYYFLDEKYYNSAHYQK